MSNQEPFRSRPRVERRPKSDLPPPPSEQGEGEEIIEGVIEEHIPAPQQPSILPAPPRAYEPLRLPMEVEQPRSRQKRVEHPGLLLLAIGLVIGGLFITILRNANLPDVIEEWYPALSLVCALVWCFMALTRRDVRAFLGGAVIFGFSLSLLLETQNVAHFTETIAGVLLMSFGLAIVMRGLLIRPSLQR
jgi:hypothetical protein